MKRKGDLDESGPKAKPMIWSEVNELWIRYEKLTFFAWRKNQKGHNQKKVGKNIYFQAPILWVSMLVFRDVSPLQKNQWKWNVDLLSAVLKGSPITVVCKANLFQCQCCCTRLSERMDFQKTTNKQTHDFHPKKKQNKAQVSNPEIKGNTWSTPASSLKSWNVSENAQWLWGNGAIKIRGHNTSVF